MAAILLVAVSIVSPVIFAAVIRLTRAGGRRTQGAIAACFAAVVFSLCWDALAVQLGWWSFPSSSDLIATLALSIFGAFVFGGAAGLTGWRIMRSGGWSGAATFVCAFVGMGLLRDHLLDANTQLFAFGEELTGQVMAAVGYVALALIVQITMLAVAGHPRHDDLRVN